MCDEIRLRRMLSCCLTSFSMKPYCPFASILAKAFTCSLRLIGKIDTSIFGVRGGVDWRKTWERGQSRYLRHRLRIWSCFSVLPCAWRAGYAVPEWRWRYRCFGTVVVAICHFELEYIIRSIDSAAAYTSSLSFSLLWDLTLGVSLYTTTASHRLHQGRFELFQYLQFLQQLLGQFFLLEVQLLDL